MQNWGCSILRLVYGFNFFFLPLLPSRLSVQHYCNSRTNKFLPGIVSSFNG
jgi:hypothetical protein